MLLRQRAAASARQLGVRHLSPATQARRLCSAAAAEPVGLGVSSEEICGVGRAALVNSMMNKIDMPARFLPVSSVFVRPATGDAGDDGALWRSMVFNGPGPLGGTTIVEHIYANPSAGVIRFVALDPDGSESEYEEVNALASSPLRIEYFRRHRETRERVHDPAPRSSALHAIATTIAHARSKEAQQLDPTFVGSKA
jgi:hypothetical protein